MQPSATVQAISEYLSTVADILEGGAERAVVIERLRTTAALLQIPDGPARYVASMSGGIEYKVLGPMTVLELHTSPKAVTTKEHGDE
jgi:hypothetical protein